MISAAPGHRPIAGEHGRFPPDHSGFLPDEASAGKNVEKVSCHEQNIMGRRLFNEPSEFSIVAVEIRCEKYSHIIITNTLLALTFS